MQKFDLRCSKCYCFTQHVKFCDIKIVIVITIVINRNLSVCLFVLRQLTSVLTRNDWRNDRDSILRSKELENRAGQSASGTWGRGCGGVNSEPPIGTANPRSAHAAQLAYCKKRCAKLQARNSFYSKNVIGGSQFGKPQMINA